MNKILSFILNENNEFLLLKGNPNDLQFHKSIWYVVTGACEEDDILIENTVKREIKEETGLTDIKDILYLNWIFKYNSLGTDCTEYAYITFVKKSNIILNEENIDYKWYSLDEFIDNIYWFGDKKELKNVLSNAMKHIQFFKNTRVDIIN